MDDGLASGTVTMILLDDCGSFRWLTFPDYGCAVTIPITVVIAVARANRYASTHRSNAYTYPNVVSQRGGSCSFSKY